MILTRLPYITFFSQVVSYGLPFSTLNCTIIMFLNLQLQKIAPDYFTNGLPSLETGNMSPPPCFLLSPYSPPSIPLSVIPPSCPPHSSSMLQHQPVAPSQTRPSAAASSSRTVNSCKTTFFHFLLFQEVHLILSLCHSQLMSFSFLFNFSFS